MEYCLLFCCCSRTHNVHAMRKHMLVCIRVRTDCEMGWCGLQGMPMYGQGHLVPVGNIAMQPQQPYGYMSPAPLPQQGAEGMPLPMMPMAVAPQLAHLQQQAMYADYHTAASAQVRGVPGCTL